MNQLECRPTINQLRISITIMMFIIIGLASCRSPDISRETHIRDTTYTIVPPAIIDSGVMQIQLSYAESEDGFRDTNYELSSAESEDGFREETPKSPKGTLWDSCFVPAKVDTIYQYARISGGDTTVRITFVPRTRWVYYKIKPDTIYYTARDTLTKYETKETVIETPWMAKVGIFSYGIISVLMAGLIIYLINWYKYGRAKPAIIEADNDDGLP